MHKEGWLEARQVVEQAAERPDVYLKVEGLLAHDLRARVQRRAKFAHRDALAIHVDNLDGDAHVCDLQNENEVKNSHGSTYLD